MDARSTKRNVPCGLGLVAARREIIERRRHQLAALGEDPEAAAPEGVPPGEVEWISGQRLDVPELGAIERISVCHAVGYDSYYWRQLELEFTLGGEVASGGRGETVLIGGYSVAIYAAETHFLCPGTGSDCSDPDERDVAVVVSAP